MRSGMLRDACIGNCIVIGRLTPPRMRNTGMSRDLRRIEVIDDAMAEVLTAQDAGRTARDRIRAMAIGTKAAAGSIGIR